MLTLVVFWLIDVIGDGLPVPRVVAVVMNPVGNTMDSSLCIIGYGGSLELVSSDCGGASEGW